MQDDQQPQPERSPGRRAMDSTDAMALLKDTHAKVLKMEAILAALSTAFVLNDLNQPDFDGHRKDHLTRMKEAAVLDSYKQDLTKKVIGVLVTFMAGLLASGFVMQVAERIK